MTPQKVPLPPEPLAGPVEATYPGGDDSPAYRRVFDLGVVLFLGVICLGLLNYLGIYAKTF